MASKKLVSVKDFCFYHSMPVQLIHDLHQHEVITLVMVKRTGFIEEKQLHLFEKIARLYNELNLNSLESIQITLQLLARLEDKDAELAALKAQLRFHVYSD